jgi:hypothetical protein
MVTCPDELLLREHMLYRLRARTTFLSLSGLPEFPSTRVQLGVAAWYVFTAEPRARLAPALPARRCVVLACEREHMARTIFRLNFHLRLCVCYANRFLVAEAARSCPILAALSFITGQQASPSTIIIATSFVCFN